MYCPYCGAQDMPGARFCVRCGRGLPIVSAAIPPQPMPAYGFISSELAPPAEKKGTHLVPILIMAVMAAIGLFLYFATGSTAVSPSMESDTPWFRNDDGVLYFYEQRYTGGDEITVPETVDGQTVLYLADGCFAGCDELTTVILPNTLKGIGVSAFENCTAMRGVFLPEGLEVIGDRAFQSCGSLEAVHIPGSVATIGRRAFYGCGVLKYIMYGDTFANWGQLYNGIIPSNPEIYCTDGTFFHDRIHP